MKPVLMAWGGRALSAALVLAWWAWAVLHLGALGDRLDLGYLFYLGLVGFGLLAYAAGRWTGRALPVGESVAALLVVLAACVFVEGVRLSALELFSIHAMPWYTAASVLLWAAVQCYGVPPLGEQGRAGAWSGWKAVAALGLVAAASAALVLWADTQIHGPWALFEDRTSSSLFFFRRYNNATDLGGAPFRQPWLLVWPVLYAAVVATTVAWLIRGGRSGARSAFWTLLILSMLGKLVLAALSTEGVALIGSKISSVNTAYYTLAAAIDDKGLLGFIRDYNDIQFKQGPHGDTHPFGPMVLYWGLRSLLGSRPFLVGLGMALLCSLTLWPIHALARRAYGSAEAGLAAALLYMLSPAGLMLAGAGIDAFVALLVALLIERIDAAVRRDDTSGLVIRAGTAGVVLFTAMIMGFGSAVVLVFAGLYALHVGRGLGGSLLEGLRRAVLAMAVALGTAMLGHLLLLAVTGGGHDYIASLNAASAAHRSANFSRHYELWAWANTLLFVTYLGMGSLAAWALRFGKALWQADARDGWLVFGSYMALMLAAAAMGRGEVQREFLYGMIFLAVPAAAYALGQPDQPRRVRWGLLAMAGVFNLATAVVLQVYVLDFW